MQLLRRALPAVGSAFAIVAGSVPAVAEEAYDISFSADLRLRHESIRQQTGPDKQRERYRARLGLTASTPGNFEWQLRLATSNGDPVSTNLNFGEGFSLSDIRIDRVSVSWSASDVAHLDIGKMKNPLQRGANSNLIWDSDLNPEGLAATFRVGSSFIIAGAFQMADSSRDDKAPLLALQYGFEWAAGPKAAFRTGLSYFDYGNVRGGAPLKAGRADGNSIDSAGNYLHDYDIVALFADHTMQVAEVPLQLFVELARNTATGDANKAFATGFVAGRTDAPGSAEFSWSWRETAADALIGLFTDSDFGGGRTDSRGHMFSLRYAVTSQVLIGGTFIDSSVRTGNTNHGEYHRAMLDVEFRF
jgi:hypothetical protein